MEMGMHYGNLKTLTQKILEVAKAKKQFRGCCQCSPLVCSMLAS